MNRAVALLAVIFSFCAYSAFPGQPASGTLLWSYSAPSTIMTSPALGPDGTIYIGTATALYAITNAGSNRWSFPVGFSSGGGPIGSPSIGTDGTIYFGVSGY